MTEEQKLKLAKAKKVQILEAYSKTTALHKEISALVAEEEQKHIVELNNSLVKFVSALESQSESVKELIEKNSEVADRIENIGSIEVDQTDVIKAIESIEAPIFDNSDVIKAIQGLEFPETKDIPDWLASDKSVKELGDKLDKIAKSLVQKQGQAPADFVPFRRVIQVGNILKFDDNPSGGGGSSLVLNTEGLATSAKQDDIIAALGGGSKTERYDVEGTVVYVGEADMGSSESDAVWTIFKYTLTDMTQASGKVAVNVAWSNRTGVTYQ